MSLEALSITKPTSLQSLFHKHRRRPWIFVRNLGNWGDILLFKGAEALASRAGIDWTSYETPDFQNIEFSKDHCIYLQGGGGFNAWSSGRAFVNLQLAVRRQVRLVVQGPMTVGGDSNWLSDQFHGCLSSVQSEEVWIFAREQQSFDSLCKLSVRKSKAPSIAIDHDTALAFSSNDLLELSELSAVPDGKYDLLVVREDPEQPLSSKHQLNAPYRGQVALDPAYEATSFRHWLRIHLFARTIVTNRLHSSLVGYIAGKPVSLGPGSYHKNRSVWEFSMRGNGPQWIDALPAVESLWNRLPERLRHSYKLRLLRFRFHGLPSN